MKLTFQLESGSNFVHLHILMVGSFKGVMTEGNVIVFVCKSDHTVAVLSENWEECLENCLNLQKKVS